MHANKTKLDSLTFSAAVLNATTASFTTGLKSTYDGYAATIASKQATLVSGTNIKTINSNSLLGSGDISVATLIGYTPYNSTNPSSYIALTALSSTVTGITYTNTTGAFSATSGFTIPADTSIAHWRTAYGRVFSVAQKAKLDSLTIPTSRLNSITGNLASGAYANISLYALLVSPAFTTPSLGDATANSIKIDAGQYLNFGATSGTTGYGIKDSSGVLKYKMSGGQWIPLNSLSNSLLTTDDMKSLTNTSEILLPANVAGWGECEIGDNQEWAQFRFSSAGVVVLVANSQHVLMDGTTASNLQIYQKAAGQVALKNLLGSTLKLGYSVHYYTP